MKAGPDWDPHRLGDLAEASPGPAGAYVHLPYCRHHCWYCDFNVHVGGEGSIAAYLAALEAETAAVAGILGPMPGLDSVYVGGGTPSHVGPERLGRILRLLRRELGLGPRAEFSVEANPADAGEELFQAMVAAGATRLSLGVQSFNDHRLGLLDRDHRADGAQNAVEMARSAGFDSISIDLIYGSPGQSLPEWRADLERAAAMGLQHVSCYALTVYSRRAQSRAAEIGQIPDDDGMFRYYQAALDILGSAGFEHYETSNWSRPGHRCRHNSAVWRGARYLPLGCGAHGFLGSRRYHLVRRPDRYVERVKAGKPLLAGFEVLGRIDLLREAVTLPLRTRAGIDLGRLEAEFGYDLRAEHGPSLRKLESEGLIVARDGHIGPSDRGMFLADALGSLLMPSD